MYSCRFLVLLLKRPGLASQNSPSTTLVGTTMLLTSYPPQYALNLTLQAEEFLNHSNLGEKSWGTSWSQGISTRTLVAKYGCTLLCFDITVDKESLTRLFICFQIHSWNILPRGLVMQCLSMFFLSVFFFASYSVIPIDSLYFIRLFLPMKAGIS